MSHVPRHAEDIPALTGIRGIAAFAVFIAHAGFWQVNPAFAAPARFFHWHGQAVDLFFVLSGFILCHVYGAVPTKGWGSFFLARIARIYPLHLLVLFYCVLGIWLGFYKEVWDSELFWKQFFLVNLWPGFFTISKWNAPQWSISVEWFCYIFIFQAAALLASFFKGPRLVPILILFAFLVVNALQVYLWKSPYLDLTRGLLGFSAGIALYHSAIAFPVLRSAAVRIADVLGLAWLILMILGGLNVSTFDWMIPLFPFLILGLTEGKSLTARLFSSSFFIWFGNISYAVYLIHYPLLKTLQDTGVRDFASQMSLPWQAAYVFAVILMVISLSHLIYYQFEKPSRFAIRRVGSFFGKFLAR